MQIAATYALANLPKQGNVSKQICEASNVESIEYGPEYIIPKPLDPRVLVEESIAVAKAAVETGVARAPITDWDAYRAELEAMAIAIQQFHSKISYYKREAERLASLFSIKLNSGEFLLRLV